MLYVYVDRFFVQINAFLEDFPILIAVETMIYAIDEDVEREGEAVNGNDSKLCQ